MVGIDVKMIFSILSVLLMKGYEIAHERRKKSIWKEKPKKSPFFAPKSEKCHEVSSGRQPTRKSPKGDETEKENA